MLRRVCEVVTSASRCVTVTLTNTATGVSARRAVLLQTDSSDRSQVISGEQTKALPLNG